MSVLQIILAVLLPPLSVLLRAGLGLQFLLNVLLTLIGWIPGVIHALWVLYSGSSPRTVTA